VKVLEIQDKKKRVSIVKGLILSAGNHIGSVHFRKRSDGSKRRMSYRLHVKEPTYAKAPSGKKSYKHRKINDENDLVTVFDCNKIKYNHKDRICGRGEYRSIPLDTVYRICVNGEIYKVI